MKVAVIGGGSTYTPELVEGLALWQLRGGPGHVSLHDIDAARLSVVSAFSARMSAALNSGLVVEVQPDFDKAVEGADFVVFQIRVGGQEARHEDIRMGLDRGLIGQETTGVGGFAKALRTIPVVLDMARRVREANPKAWIINFTNPSGIVTEAICRFATTRCIGLCNVPTEFQMDVARHLRVAPEDVVLDWVGLNHLGWVRRILVRGEDALPYLLETFDSERGPKNIPDLDYPRGFLKALGMVPSSYCRYYYMPDQMLSELRRKPRTRAQEVMEIEERLLAYYRDPVNVVKPLLLSERGGAWYSRIAVDVMAALGAAEPRRLIVNTLNRGSFEELPGDASVEVPCLVNAADVVPLPLGEVDERILGLIRQVKSYERLTVQAAVTRDPDLALMALVANPLVPSVSLAADVLQALKKRSIL
jgi:6-phospho-beta-glucosidase